jgi:hypothetical protein
MAIRWDRREGLGILYRTECLRKRQREVFDALARVWLFPEALAVFAFRFSWPAFALGQNHF